jgi:hypothetical protein
MKAMMRKKFWLSVTVGGLIFGKPVYATTGLSGLGGLYYLAVMIAAGFFLVLPCVVIANRLKNKNRAKTRVDLIFIIMAIVYLLALSPFFIWILFNPRLALIPYLILYIILLTGILWYFFERRQLMLYLAVSIFLLAILRTPEIISYDDYQVIDNNPLESTIKLARQKDNQYIHLEDGRIFRFRERYNSSGQEGKFEKDAPLMVVETGVSDGKHIFMLFGIKSSQEYYQYENFREKPLFTIPLVAVSMEKNAIDHLGTIELLDSDWKADDTALKRAITQFCCDSAWVQELIDRGANPKQVSDGINDYNLLHWISGDSPYSVEKENIARILVESGTELNAMGDRGETPLSLAVNEIIRERLSDSEISYVRLLLELGANPNIGNGYPLLHNALVHREFELTMLLLKYGADPKIKDSRGYDFYAVVEELKGTFSGKVLENVMKQLATP